VSTETIYRSLFVQARGVLRKELMAHLRTRRSVRRSRLATTKGQGRGGIIDAISIQERPAEADDRAVPGHWEGDLLAGSARIAGLSTPRAALRIAWICSILFTLNAGRA
jgi:IS30 family transposase